MVSQEKDVLSDHYLLSLAVNVESPLKSTASLSEKIVRSFSNVDWLSLDCFLMDADFSGISLGHYAEVSCANLYSVLFSICDCHIPMIKVPSNPSPPWFNSEIRHTFNKIRTIKRRIKKHPASSKVRKHDSLVALLD